MTPAQYQSSRFYTQRQVSENPDGTPPPIIVKVSLINPANRARAEQAAVRLTQAVNRELQRLEAANASAIITVLGRSYIVGEVLADLNNTEFTVTDRTDFQNNGVGASARGSLGQPNTDIINMEAILEGYGHPNYPNDLGMIALIFHELAHISQIGTDFFNESIQFWNSEPADQRGNFYPSDYSRNNEAFGNDFKNLIHGILGIAPGPDPGGYTNARERASIYQEHADSW